MEYRKLSNSEIKVSEIALGCESNCPFGVSIIEKMEEAVEIFGF